MKKSLKITSIFEFGEDKSTKWYKKFSIPIMITFSSNLIMKIISLIAIIKLTYIILNYLIYRK